MGKWYNMSDQNNQALTLNIQNQLHRRITGAMGIGGGGGNPMEPLSIDGIFSQLVSMIETGGLIPMAAALVCAKGLNNIKGPNFEALGLLNQPTPSMFVNLFQKSPNIFSGR